MSDLVSVALISSGSAIAVALVTQYLATRAANRSSDRAEKREALQWQRSEALRLEELKRKEAQEAISWQRSEAQRIQTLQAANLRELWGHVQVTQTLMLDLMQRVLQNRNNGAAPIRTPSASSPAAAATQAYAVALLNIPFMRACTHEFQTVTGHLEVAIEDDKQDVMDGLGKDWMKAFAELEKCAAMLADKLGENDLTAEAEA